MFPASVLGPGMCMSFLDICKTEAGPAIVPIPYPNIAECAIVDPASAADTVMLEGLPALTEISEFLLSEGDEAGELGGLISEIIMGPCMYLMGSPLVLVEGMPAAVWLSPTMHNGAPAANDFTGLQTVPSTLTVFFEG